jgi:hypothetical protein
MMRGKTEREVEDPLTPIPVTRLAPLPCVYIPTWPRGKTAYILCLHPKAFRPFGIFRNSACSRIKLAFRLHGWHDF